MTNGNVYATALSGDRKVLYIGGEFTEVRQKSGVSYKVSNVAAINVKTGAAIRTWRPKVSGKDAVVRSLAVKNGKVFIGGNFTAVEGKPRKNLAAVGAHTKAVVLSPFAPQVGSDASYVFALEAGERKLYAGGGFSKVNGAPRKNLAAFSLKTGALDRHWKPKATKAPTCKDPKCSHKVRALELGPGEPTAKALRDRAWRAFTLPRVICTRGRSQAGRSKLHRRRGTSPQHAPGSTAASGAG
jgi:hypothetical protein